MKKDTNRKVYYGGITAIEIILVISIVAIIAATSAPFLSNSILRSNLTNTTSQLIGAIRKAQEYAMNGRDGEVWGICQSGNSIRLFSGSCSSPTYFEDYTIPSNVTISGLSTSTFSSTRGVPDPGFSITVSTDIGSSTIDMNIGGGMDIN